MLVKGGKLTNSIAHGILDFHSRSYSMNTIISKIELPIGCKSIICWDNCFWGVLSCKASSSPSCPRVEDECGDFVWEFIGSALLFFCILGVGGVGYPRRIHRLMEVHLRAESGELP